MIEFDSNRRALFEPNSLNLVGEPTRALMVFDDEVWDDYIVPNEEISSFPVKNIYGRVFSTFRMYEHMGENILLIYPSTGASASAMDLELLIASGISKIVSFGTCGAMDRGIAKNSIIIPSSAVREEGTSYHYLPDGEEISQKEKFVNIMDGIFEKGGFERIHGKVWTTDAVYRETEGKLKSMKERGCVVVDMELSALLAVAEFRGIEFASFLIAHDNIDGKAERENPRELKKIFETALEVVSML